MKQGTLFPDELQFMKQELSHDYAIAKYKIAIQCKSVATRRGMRIETFAIANNI